MPVRTLALTGFRSYLQLELELEDGPHVVVGRNAAGKTNLVESLVVLSAGRSHRSAADSELVRWGSDFARASASVVSAERTQELEVVIHAPGAAASGARKRVRVNGVNRRAAALRPVLRSVLFAPEDMLLVVGSPSLRRNLLDALVVQREPIAAAVMSTYARCLTQRNSLLRRIREDGASRDELRYWDGVICENGGRLLDWRRETLDALATPLADAHREIAPDETPLALRYVSNTQREAGESHEDALLRRLRETAEKEIWNGATLVGPHRDDLQVRINGMDAGAYASRGQARTAVLTMRLSESRYLAEQRRQEPILLLDDVLSELDPDRRRQVLDNALGYQQCFVTTTDANSIEDRFLSRMSRLTVSQGQVARSNQS